jgi:hypothetical protein
MNGKLMENFNQKNDMARFAFAFRECRCTCRVEDGLEGRKKG